MQDRRIVILICVTILLTGGLCGFLFTGTLAFTVFRRASGAPPIVEVSTSPPVTGSSPVPGAVTPVPTSTPLGTLFTELPLFTSPTPTPTATSFSKPTETQTPQGLVATTAVPSPTYAPISSDAWCVPWNTSRTNARVLRVIDGVTIEVDIGGEVLQVRYIGMDLPDFSSDFDIWTESRTANDRLVGGKTVLLVRDKSDIDNQARLLRYVIAEGVFVNYQLILDGYAVAASYPPDVNCDYLFLEAGDLALAANRGVWALTPTPTRIAPVPTQTPLASGIVTITTLKYEGAKIRDEPNEYVEIRNNDSSPIQLFGWTLRNNRNRIYTFPNYIIQPGQYCRVYTNEYHPDTCGFSFFSLSPIWQDSGDCALLMDNQGVLIDSFCYQ